MSVGVAKREPASHWITLVDNVEASSNRLDTVTLKEQPEIDRAAIAR
jgi:hypothetical protein